MKIHFIGFLDKGHQDQHGCTEVGAEADEQDVGLAFPRGWTNMDPPGQLHGGPWQRGQHVA